MNNADSTKTSPFLISILTSLTVLHRNFEDFDKTIFEILLHSFYCVEYKLLDNQESYLHQLKTCFSLRHISFKLLQQYSFQSPTPTRAIYNFPSNKIAGQSIPFRIPSNSRLTPFQTHPKCSRISFQCNLL